MWSASVGTAGYGHLAHLRNQAEADGARRLAGEFKATAKNGQVRDFYERHGFVLLDGTPERKTLELLLPASTPEMPGWIGMVRE